MSETFLAAMGFGCMFLTALSPWFGLVGMVLFCLVPFVDNSPNKR